MPELTPEMMDETVAGRELDALVAELIEDKPTYLRPYSEVVANERAGEEPEYSPERAWVLCSHVLTHEVSWEPNYFSTDIAAAWLVVEKLMEEGDVFLEYWSDDEWFVSNRPIGVRESAVKAHCDGQKTGKPSLPLAICRAALKAILFKQ